VAFPDVFQLVVKVSPEIELSPNIATVVSRRAKIAPRYLSVNSIRAASAKWWFVVSGAHGRSLLQRGARAERRDSYLWRVRAGTDAGWYRHVSSISFNAARSAAVPVSASTTLTVAHACAYAQQTSRRYGTSFHPTETCVTRSYCRLVHVVVAFASRASTFPDSPNRRRVPLRGTVMDETSNPSESMS
jgi:hypothetical protein